MNTQTVVAKMPTNRDELFEHLKMLDPNARYGLSFLHWDSTLKGKPCFAALTGQVLQVGGLAIFCSPESTLPGRDSGSKARGFAIMRDNENFTSFQYDEMEEFLRIVSEHLK